MPASQDNTPVAANPATRIAALHCLRTSAVGAVDGAHHRRLGKETALSKSAGQHSIRVFFWAAVGHDRPLRPIPSFVGNRPLTGRGARTRRRCEIGLEDRVAGDHLLRAIGCVLDLNPIKARSAVIAFTAADATFASFRARNRRPDPGRCTFSNVWLVRKADVPRARAFFNTRYLLGRQAFSRLARSAAASSLSFPVLPFMATVSQ